MDSVRVNVILPEKLLEDAKALVDKGYFKNFSEVVREGLRREVMSYRFGLGELTERDRMLLEWVRKEEASGDVLSESDLEKHGLKL